MASHTSSNALAVRREQAIAFRLVSQHLNRRQPPGALLPVVGMCGIYNTPPGSALLALHARLEGITSAVLTNALEVDKTLLQVWSLRASPVIFPTQDAAIFTRGLLPQDEAALRHFIRGSGPLVDQLGWSIGELVERVRPGLRELLDGPSLPFRRLSAELTYWLAAGLASQELSVWQSPSGFAPGQRLGEALVHFALRPLSLAGELCFAPRIGVEAGFTRPNRWLGAPLPEADAFQAGLELARRYLHAYGPSTVRHFSEWSGMAPHQAERLWHGLQAELAPVSLEGRNTWLLAADLDDLKAAGASGETPAGVRFLPPDDPLLALRDRETFVSQRNHQRTIWRTTGRPGVILMDGGLAGTWRMHKTGHRLEVLVELFDLPAPEARARIEAQAETLAPLRSCTSLLVSFLDSGYNLGTA